MENTVTFKFAEFAELRDLIKEQNEMMRTFFTMVSEQLSVNKTTFTPQSNSENSEMVKDLNEVKQELQNTTNLTSNVETTTTLLKEVKNELKDELKEVKNELKSTQDVEVHSNESVSTDDSDSSSESEDVKLYEFTESDLKKIKKYLDNEKKLTNFYSELKGENENLTEDQFDKKVLELRLESETKPETEKKEKKEKKTKS
jgi:hypothetical protein